MNDPFCNVTCNIPFLGHPSVQASLRHQVAPSLEDRRLKVQAEVFSEVQVQALEEDFSAV